MNEYLDPLPDELLTSWFARRRHNLRGRGLPEPKAVRDSKGAWRHPDIRPTRTWLNSACDRFNVEPSQLAASTFVRRFPHLPVDFLAWDWAPFPTEREGLRPAPRLAIAWCSRCLAEDFAVGRPAHIRQQWVNASLGFCHLHRWPLSDRCAACGSIRWKFAAPTRGPLRMLCAECWRPLERSLPEVLHASKELRDCWDCVIAFEAEVQTALRGRTPDQFRFNFTSASQLLNEVRDICGLLARNRLGFTPSSIPLNAYACTAMKLGLLRPEFLASDSLFPLAVASVLKRRCMLAAACAILDAKDEAGRLLYAPSDPPAIESFISAADNTAIDKFLAEPARWSPSFGRRIKETRRRARHHHVVGKLERTIWALNRSFASAG